jgi:hypothetical protein
VVIILGIWYLQKKRKQRKEVMLADAPKIPVLPAGFVLRAEKGKPLKPVEVRAELRRLAALRVEQQREMLEIMAGNGR